MTSAPDVTIITNIHNQMRLDTRRFVEAVRTASPADRAGRLRPLARWAVGFGHELHLHHTIEDTISFPALAKRVPTLLGVLDGLEADHETVAEILQEWGPAAGRLADPRVPFAPAQVHMLVLATTLRNVLSRHLDIEDNDVLPLFTQHFSLEEYEALDAKIMKSMPKTGLGFSVPWNVFAQDDDTREHILATAPLPLRLIFGATKSRFLRLTAQAFPTHLFGQKPVVYTGF